MNLSNFEGHVVTPQQGQTTRLGTAPAKEDLGGNGDPSPGRVPVNKIKEKAKGPRRFIWGNSEPKVLTTQQTRPYRHTEPAPIPSELEFIALQSYLTSNAFHALPPSLDPSQPLDSFAILGTALNQEIITELKEESESVVLWLDDEIPAKRMNDIIAFYALAPPPFIIQTAERHDLLILQNLLGRLVPSSEFPIPLPMVVIGGQPVIGFDALLELHQSGRLKVLIENAGSKVDGTNLKPKEIKRRAQKMEELLPKV